MHKDLHLLLQATAVIAALAISGCSSDSTSASTPGPDAGCPAKDNGCPAKDGGCPAKDAGCPAEPPANAGTSDLPATGPDADVRAWLAKGDYKTGTWKCEAAPHAARSPSPHGINRICSNATLSAHGSGQYPVGSAGVKELYDQAGTNVIGHAVYRKLKVGAAESWYWWEDLNNSTVANGTGDQGSAKSICASCHMGAPNDFVFTQVK